MSFYHFTPFIKLIEVVSFATPGRERMARVVYCTAILFA